MDFEFIQTEIDGQTYLVLDKDLEAEKTELRQIIRATYSAPIRAALYVADKARDAAKAISTTYNGKTTKNTTIEDALLENAY